MIEFDHLTYSYPDPKGLGKPLGSERPVLDDVSLHVDEGAFVLVIGPSGAGKSTLLRCINGLVPHFYGGTIEGRIRVFGRDPVALEPRRMSETVGFVFQDPEAQAVVDVVEDELAFAMENQGLPLTTMRKRVEEVLDQLHIAHLRRRPLSTLSGGERQRVAIASVLTLQPQILILDEPTSQLDPQAAEEVLDTLVKLNHDLGLTILLSEHRLERVAQYADQVLYVPGPGQHPLIGAPREILAAVPLVPPLVELGKRLNWSPLPLTIKEARKFTKKLPLPSPEPRAPSPEPQAPGFEGRTTQHRAASRPHLRDAPRNTHHAIRNTQHCEASRLHLRDAISRSIPTALEGRNTQHCKASRPHLRDATSRSIPTVLEGRNTQYAPRNTHHALDIHALQFAYNGQETLRGIDLTVRRGEFVAIMGRNGAGKTTLLKQCVGLLKPREGRVRVMGLDTQTTPLQDLSAHIAYVPQNPNALLFAETIADELAFTRRARGLPADDDSALLETLGLAEMRDRYPRDLSVGERQRAALAAVLVGDPEVILLDEPTRGLDYAQKASLIEFLQAQQARGKTIVVVTHDVELVAQCARRVVLMGDGEIVVDGPVRDVMSDSQVFASQINKLLRDPRYLTVQDVVGLGMPGQGSARPGIAPNISSSE